MLAPRPAGRTLVKTPGRAPHVVRAGPGPGSCARRLVWRLTPCRYGWVNDGQFPVMAGLAITGLVFVPPNRATSETPY